MPLGNLTGSGTRRPSGPRSFSDQQSSMLMYWYPAAFSPEVTKTSAVCRMRVSSTSHPNAFQLLNPIGGVAASVAGDGAGDGAADGAGAAATGCGAAPVSS